MDTTTRALRRPNEGRMLAGVCAALARHFGLDVTLVRLGLVLFTLLGGSGVLAYLIGWLMIPDEQGQRATAPLILLVLMVGVPFLCFLISIPLSIIGNN